VINDFCKSQFDKEQARNGLIDYDTKEFLDTIQGKFDKGEIKLIDGYAPFCKHLFVPNFTNAISSFIKITPENKKFLNSDYVARKDNELPVLERWFEISDMPEGAISSYF